MGPSAARRSKALLLHCSKSVLARILLPLPSDLCYCYNVQGSIQELIERATERLVAEFHPDEIWLFGSQAWGAPGEDSDVDLMVIVPESDERPTRRMQRAHRCLQGIGFAKDVLVPTRAEVDRYKHLRASLFHQVLSRGRRLYG